MPIPRTTGGGSIPRGRVDQFPDGGDAVGRKSTAPRVLADDVLVGREVYAVELVPGDIAVKPLDPRAQFPEDRVRLPRGRSQVFLGELPQSRYVSFDHELGHPNLLS